MHLLMEQKAGLGKQKANFYFTKAEFHKKKKKTRGKKQNKAKDQKPKKTIQERMKKKVKYQSKPKFKSNKCKMQKLKMTQPCNAFFQETGCWVSCFSFA